jgi:hypothetical protein
MGVVLIQIKPLRKFVWKEEVDSNESLFNDLLN